MITTIAGTGLQGYTGDGDAPQNATLYSPAGIAFDKDDEEIFAFGKHKGIKVNTILEKEPGYFSWMQNADFPLYTKMVLTAIKLRKLNTK